MRGLALALLAVATSCDRGEPASQQEPAPNRCLCRPENVGPMVRFSHSEKPPGPLSSRDVLEELRRGTRDRNASDEKVALIVEQMCEPCNVYLRTTPVAELFPLGRLDEAVGAGCMFLELRDGTRVYGKRFNETIGSECR